MVKFSITIPAYKGQYLKECIESVLAQTYTYFELIIVNDNSPEDLATIVGSFNDKRIRYYKNDKGCGSLRVVDNWNICLKYSTGDYILCMGDDDKLLPNCLTDYAKLIVQYPNLEVFHSFTEIIDENSLLIDIQHPQPEFESIYSLIWNFWKGREQFIGDHLFRTSSLRERGGFIFTPYAWSADKLTIYEAIGAKGIASTSRPGFQYRRNTHNITSNSSNLQGRYYALLIERDWYREFLQQTHTINNALDKKYYRLISRHLERRMQEQLDSMMYWDVTDNPNHYKFWKSKQKEFNISNEAISHARYIHYKEKIKRILRK